jgi:hypothetical protein
LTVPTLGIGENLVIFWRESRITKAFMRDNCWGTCEWQGLNARIFGIKKSLELMQEAGAMPEKNPENQNAS